MSETIRNFCGQKMKYFRTQILLQAGLLVACSYPALAAPIIKAVPPDWRYSGGPEALVKAQVGQVLYDGAYAPVVKISASGQPGNKPAIIQQSFNTKLFKVDLSQEGVLAFKAKFVADGVAQPLLKLQLIGPGLNLSKVFSPADGVAAKDGFADFRWDIKSQVKPQGRQGNSLTEVRFVVDAPGSQPDDRLDVAIIDLRFEGDGQTAESKTRVPPAQWKSDGALKYRNVPLKGWSVDKEEAAAGIKIENVTETVGGKKLPALRLTYSRGEKISPVSLPLAFNADRENVFTFKAKVEAPAGSKQLGNVEAPLTGWYSYQFNHFFDNFGIGMRDKHGVDWTALAVPRTHFLQHLDKTQPEVDGFKNFRWDMKNENPTGNKGFDLEAVSHVQFFYDNRKLKDGEKTVITIIAPQLVSGLHKSGGDEKKFAAFEKYITGYQPDYSDSSKYLSSPEEGRLPQPLPLVKDGKPLAEIVGTANVWSPEGNAVRELYGWLYRLTDGVEIPVFPKPSAAENTKIFVGTAHAKAFFAEDIERLKDSDGCAIRTRGNSVYIFGATGKGTLNGVYTFLEGNSDIIWPHTSDLYDAIYSANPNLTVKWGDYFHRALARNWGWMGKTQGPDFDYQVRNRANYLGLRSDVNFKYWGLYMEEGGGHNLHSWIPFSLWKTNPEYWAMIDGERQHPNGYKNQICLNNEDGKAIFTRRIREYIEKNPQVKAADCMNIKIEDNWGVCECPECIRPIRLPDGTLLDKDDIAFRSTQFFMFLNSVANALHNDGLPKMEIGTYVYFYTVPVPRIPVTSALRPYFADYVRKDYKVPIYAPINDIWWRVLNEWTQVSDKVVIREYTGIYVNFRPMAEVAAHDIRAALESGTLEFTSESLLGSTSEFGGLFPHQMDVSMMEYWLILRLYWDPEADVEQLRKYFLRRTFREAAPEMEKFYGTIRQLYFTEKRTTDFEENHETLRLVMRKGKEAELRTLLETAQNKAEHPLSKQMVTLVLRRYNEWTQAVKQSG